MLKHKIIKILSILLIFLCSFNILVSAEHFHNNQLDEDGIPIGEHKALDSNGKVIEDVDVFLKKRDSDWMYTGISTTYALRDGVETIGYFKSGGRYRIGFNQSIINWSQFGSEAWSRYPAADGAWADVSITGSYKPNDTTARLTITGETGDIVFLSHASMDHVYWFYGNGTWDMKPYY